MNATCGREENRDRAASTLFDIGADKSRMSVESRKLCYFRRAFADFRLRSRDVLAILAAARIGAIRRRDKAESASDAVVPHLPHGVGKEGVPVPIAPVDGHVRAFCREQISQCGDQRPVLVVDGALAAEVVVVFGDFEHSFARHIASAEDILEKRDHVFRFLRPTKGENEKRIMIPPASLLLIIECYP